MIPHERHIYATAADFSIAKIYACPPSQHAFPHFKCVLHFCYNFPRIDIPDQESDRHHSNASPPIRFRIYHLIAGFKVHVSCPLDERGIFRLCFQGPDTVTPAKLYTIKYIVMMETPIADFHTSFYIPEIQNLAFHLPRVHILGTNHCGNTRRESFKRHR